MSKARRALGSLRLSGTEHSRASAGIKFFSFSTTPRLYTLNSKEFRVPSQDIAYRSAIGWSGTTGHPYDRWYDNAARRFPFRREYSSSGLRLDR
jgi:hypothetical protein